MTWGAGYITEINYTSHYFQELNPGHLRLACITAGFAPPPSDRLSYLELGFGQGVSINVHAAAVPGDFWGNDFNPGQTAQARSLAVASGSGVTLLEDSFEELANRSDLPEFDMIVMHGIWSWISQENRHFITEVIRRKLRPGGLLYVSYNTSPGWLAAKPLQLLLKLHATFASSELDGPTEKATKALEFATRVRDAGALYFTKNPDHGARLDEMKGRNITYVTHEFFNDHWTPMTFLEAAGDFERAKLTFATSAMLREQPAGFALSKEGRAIVNEIKNPIFQQCVKDYFHNRQFRRDIYIKGIRHLMTSEQSELLLTQPLITVVDPTDLPAEIPGSGVTTAGEPTPHLLAEVLAEDGFRTKTIAELATHPKLQPLGLARVVQFIRLLNGPGYLSPARQPTKETQRNCMAYNRHVCEAAQHRFDVTHLASPVTGGGVFVSQLNQLFLLAMKKGMKTPADMATFAARTPALTGKSLTRDGKKIETLEENTAELNRRASSFISKTLSLLRAQGIA